MTRDGQSAKRIQVALSKVAVAERYLRLALAELKRARDAAMAPKPTGDGERKEAA